MGYTVVRGRTPYETVDKSSYAFRHRVLLVPHVAALRYGDQVDPTEWKTDGWSDIMQDVVN